MRPDLNRRLFSMFALLALLVPAFAFAEGPQNVPDVASFEMARRGNHVENTGTIRSGLRAEALSPPADDSAKWFLTLIVQANDADSAVMQKTIAHDPALAAWVNVSEPVKSQTHYQIRRFDDVTQRDWMATVRKQIEDKGVPCVILQPPRNGHFGDPSTIVKMIHGRMSGQFLSAKLREAVDAYIESLEAKQAAKLAPSPAIGAAPPFQVQPKVEPAPAFVPNANPFEYPQLEPKALTVDQIEAACPGASPQFVMYALKSKEADVKVLRLMWQIEQNKADPVKPVVCPVDCVTPEEAYGPVHDEKDHASFFVQSQSINHLATVGLVCLGLGWLAHAIAKSSKLAEIVGVIRGTKPTTPAP